MECASPIITEEINYIRNVEENMKKLKRKKDELACAEKDVRKEVANAAKWKAKKPKEEVNNWLKNVEEVENEASEMEKKMEEESKCLMGCLPNVRTLRRIGKRSLELIKEVDYLLSKRSFEGGIIAGTQPETIQILPSTSLVGSTAKQNFKLIWNLLKEENTGIIGIYGMGGVGKTTLMKKINNHLEFKKRFDIVIWVTVSKDFNLKRLQSAIAERLNLPEDLNEESLSIKLHEALCRKKFLLILDDVWHRISLEQVGIPEPRNGCKLVLTTRSHRVCELMETNTFIKIKELSKEEAWLLFKEKVGATALVDSDVEVVAKQVVDECKGLPLALISVGRALRGVSDVGRWRHALRQLKNSKPEVGDMEDDVFTKLRFSYQYLKSDKLRACFLYCSLFPEDCDIPKNILIGLWRGEGFIEEDGDAQAMVDEGEFILNELVEACMLERCSLDVKMHDLMRDMAIGITRKCPIFMVKAGIRLEKVVADKEWAEDVERISLMRNKIRMLSGEPPKCLKLVTLFLNDNPLSHFESPYFFQHINKLRVLDLSETKIEELPESISVLEKLNVLDLDGCQKLKSIPCLAKLKKLRQLYLSNTCIEELPEGMGELVELRRLNLMSTRRLRRFPIEILPRLSLLEYFNMQYSLFLWSSSSCNEGEIKEAKTGFEEFTRLTQLSSLRLCFADISSFGKFVASMRGSISKIKEFSFRVVNSTTTSLDVRSGEDFVAMNIMKCGDMKIGLPQLLLDLEILELAELMTYFGIRECKGMECLLVSPDYDNYSTHHPLLLLSKVKYLHVFFMPDLKALQKGIILVGTLANLQNLQISDCPKLKSLFSLGTLQGLQNLKRVEIVNCIAMEEVVAGEEDEKTGFNTDVTLPNLESIELSNLPALQSICSGTMVCSSLSDIDITSCCKLKKIPLIIDKPPHDFTTKLKGTREWWDALDWADLAHTKDLLESSFIEEKQTVF